MHLLPALGCHSTHPPKHVLIVQGWLGGSDGSLSFSPDLPTNALWGTNLTCTVVSPMGRRHCLPENPDKTRLHVAGNCSVENAVTLLHERDCNGEEDLIPVPDCCYIALYNNQLWFIPCAMAPQTITGLPPNLSRSSTQASAKQQQQVFNNNKFLFTPGPLRT